MTETADAEVIRMSRIIYQNLGSLVKNRSITREDDYNNEFQKIMNILDDSNLEPGSVIDSVDTYLGSLGVSEDYPYAKDINDIPAWIDVLGVTEIRNLVAVDEEGVAIETLVDENIDTLVKYKDN